MLTTFLLTLVTVFLTLLTTTFHLPNLGLVFLLLLPIWRKDHYGFLVVVASVSLSLFGQLNLGVSLILVSLIVFGFQYLRENIFPGKLLSSLILALLMLGVWEIGYWLVS
jgi:hypothetical protein